MTLKTPMSPGMTDQVRHMLGVGLPHTFTLVPVTSGSRSVWGKTALVNGTPITGLQCRYIPNVQIIRTDAGWILVTGPSHSVSSQTAESLTVPFDCPIKVGDSVQDIRAATSTDNAAGTVIEPGPITVTAEIKHAGYGPVTLRVLILRNHAVEQDH